MSAFHVPGRQARSIFREEVHLLALHQLAVDQVKQVESARCSRQPPGCPALHQREL